MPQSETDITQKKSLKKSENHQTKRHINKNGLCIYDERGKHTKKNDKI